MITIAWGGVNDGMDDEIEPRVCNSSVYNSPGVHV